jgi:hypothetical protein
MASVLIFSRPSNNHLAGHVQTLQPERGDVVDIHARDDFHWGNAVMGPAALGWWQVVVVPGATLRDLGGLLTSSSGAMNEGTLSWRHRIWRIDLDALGRGRVPGEIWNVPLQRLMVCANLKAQARETAEIGQPGWVIG